MRDREEMAKYIRASITGRPVIAEVGVLRGEFAQQYQPLFSDGVIYLVDAWETEDCGSGIEPGLPETAFEEIARKCSEWRNVVIMKMRSRVAAELFPLGFFDWVYIDANHTYEHVSEDISVWWPKVKVGGFISGHDFDPSPDRVDFGINRAVKEFFGDKFGLTGEAFFKSWYIQKGAS